MSTLTSSAFQPEDTGICMTLFQQNCPEYFAPNEQQDFAEYLLRQGNEYCLYKQNGTTVGACGYHLEKNARTARINWIMVAKPYYHSGAGSHIMRDMIARIRTCCEVQRIHISASQHSAPFFARFGATEEKTIKNGWGDGMHRIEMNITLLP